MRLRTDVTRDWRVVLLIMIDLMALLAIFPRYTHSTTDFTLTDLNSSQVVKKVLEAHYDRVTYLSSSYSNGLWVHRYSFELRIAREPDSLRSELRAQLSGMMPRGLDPSISISNMTLVQANLTVSDQDSFVTFTENGLGVKVTSVQSLKDSIHLKINKKVSQEDLSNLFGSSARVAEYHAPGTIKTNIKLGIDFLGGFYYNVKPVGVSFTVRCSAANMTPLLVTDFLNTTARVKEKSSNGLLTVEVENPENVTQGALMETIMDDFFSMNPSLRKVSLSFGNRTSDVVVNVTNYGALEAVLNRSLSLSYDIVEGKEESGVFVVEGKGSAATQTQLEANLSRYLKIIDYQAKVSKGTMTEVEKMIQSRSNFLGVSDLRIKRAGDKYIMVETPEIIAGNSSILQPLDFEARLWKSPNETIIAFTSRDVARVEHYYYYTDGWAVPLNLKTKVAEEFRNKAMAVGAVDESADVRDKHRLGMFFNGIEVYNASFSEGLASSMRDHSVVSFVAITGGPRENEEARKRAEELYINLEASFPTKLRVAGEGEIPPVLGSDFSRQVAAAAGAALVGVALVIYLRYRRPRLVLAVLSVSLSEVLIILGFAVVIRWYLDLSSVAGIIAVIGTGVDDQIVITDEALYEGEGRKRLVMSTRISRAFFIIFTAAATTIIAMSPLAYVGLGRLRGFAVVTIVGVLAGVFITRPAYGRIVRHVLGRRK